MNNCSKWLVAGLFLLLINVCFSVAFGAEPVTQKVELVTDEVLTLTPACVYPNGTRWDCDSDLDAIVRVEWGNAERTSVRVILDEVSLEVGSKNKAKLVKVPIPVKVVDKARGLTNNIGSVKLSGVSDRASGDYLVNAYNLLGKELHIGETSITYLVNTTTQYNLSNGLIKVVLEGNELFDLYVYDTSDYELKARFNILLDGIATNNIDETFEILEETNNKVVLNMSVTTKNNWNVTLEAGVPYVKFENTSVMVYGDSTRDNYFTILPVSPSGWYSYASNGTLMTNNQSANYDLAINGDESFRLVYNPSSSDVVFNVFNVLPDEASTGFRVGSDDSLRTKFYEADNSSEPSYFGIGVLSNIDTNTVSGDVATGYYWDNWTWTATAPTDYTRYWDFNEGTGTNADDKSSDDKDLTGVDTPAWVYGKQSWGTDLDGSADYWYSDDFTNLDDDTTGSISFWMYYDNDGDRSDGVVGFSRNADTAITQLYFKMETTGANNALMALCYIDGVGQWSMYENNPSASSFVDKWTHIVIVQNGTDPKMFINGAETSVTFNVATNKTKWLIDVLTTDTGTTAIADIFSVGGIKSNNAITIPFDGGVDDVRIYSRVLTQAEITALYGQGLPDCLNEDSGSCTYWGVTQDTSFVKDFAEASLREFTISRAWSDATQKYTDTYTFTNITNDFITWDGSDGVGYYGFTMVNATDASPSMTYTCPTEWGNMGATLSNTGEISYGISTTPSITFNTPSNTSYWTNPSLNFTVTGVLSTYTCDVIHNDNNTTSTEATSDSPYVMGINGVVGSNNLTLFCNFSGWPYYHNMTDAVLYTLYGDEILLDQFEANVLDTVNTTYNLTLKVNTDLINISTVQANLTWNGTTYEADTRTQGTNTVSFNKTLTMPDLDNSSPSTSVDAYWSYNYTYLNSTVHHVEDSANNQTIHPIYLEYCTSNVFLNYSMWDEVDQSAINASFYIDLDLWDSDAVTWEASYKNTTSQHEHTICLNPIWANLTMNATIETTNVTITNVSHTYNLNRYYSENTEIDNSTLSTSLYMLDTAETNDGTIEFTVQYQDNTKVSNAIIILRRLYVGDGVTNTVGMASKTDEDGVGIAFIEYLTASYALTVQQYGTTLKTESSRVFNSDDTEYTITIDDSYSLPDVVTGSPTLSTSYDSDTYLFIFNITDADGDLELTNLTIYRQGAYNETLVCTRQSTGTSGSGVCNLSSYVTGGDTFYYYIRVVEDGLDRLIDSGNIDLGSENDYGAIVPFALAVLVGMLGLLGLKMGATMAILLMIVGLNLGVLVLEPNSYYDTLPITVVLGLVLFLLARRGQQ